MFHSTGPVGAMVGGGGALGGARLGSGGSDDAYYAGGGRVGIDDDDDDALVDPATRMLQQAALERQVHVLHFSCVALSLSLLPTLLS